MLNLNKYSNTQLQFLCARLEADSKLAIANMKHNLHRWQYGERMKIQVELSKREQQSLILQALYGSQDAAALLENRRLIMQAMYGNQKAAVLLETSQHRALNMSDICFD